MKFQSYSLRLVILPIVSLLLLAAAAAFRPVFANSSKELSVAERYVLTSIKEGDAADLNDLAEDQRTISASFVANLLTRQDPRGPLQIWIRNAVIGGTLDLTNREIPHDIIIDKCSFNREINLNGSHFAKGLFFRNSRFESTANFVDTTIDYDFVVENGQFRSETYFQGVRVGRDFRIERSTFAGVDTSFKGARVGGVFSGDHNTFLSEWVLFDEMQVQGGFSLKNCDFTYDSERFKHVFARERRGRTSEVRFTGAHLGDCLLNDSRFDKISSVDLTRLRANWISFDGVKFNTPTEVKLQGLVFSLLTPMNVDKLQFLLSHYDAKVYTDLEASFRTHGYADEADKIFIAKKRAERRERCGSFFKRCDDRVGYLSNLFQDLLAGYGKRLQNLLYWSLGFLAIGVIVFRNERGMRTKDWKDMPAYTGKYHPFWYSLDLFLPIIKLGEADVWTPKDNRRWANLYKKVHIIVGSLFVPIGLAAWTGIIK